MNIIQKIQMCNFNEPLCQNNVFRNIIKPLDRVYHNEVQCKLGKTKIVILFKNDDMVIKIPLKGVYYNTLQNKIKKPFVGDDLGANYCEAETILYQLAKEKGLEEFFIETKKIGEIKDQPIYTQKRISFINKQTIRNNQFAKDYIIKNSINLELNTMNIQWVATLLEQYPKEKVDNLFIFLEDFSINDLHKDNIGYNQGNPVIIDYSGYYED